MTDPHPADRIKELRDQIGPLAAEGGVCAPLAPRYDVFSIGIPEDSPRLVRAVRELGLWLRQGGSELARKAIELNATEANVDEFARQAARVAILAYQRTPVEDLLPKISAPRGGISYLTPPDFGRPVSRRARARARWRRSTEKVRRPYRRFVAARGRLADARAVWRGEKDALTEAEQEALSEY